MSLRFIYGRAGSGKSYFCLNDIKERLKAPKNTPLVLIVPEQFSLQAERNLVRTVGDEGLSRAEVLSFQRMAHRVFGEVGGLTGKYISTPGKCMLLHRILEGMKEKLNYFSTASRQQGFVNTLSNTISEFKRYNVTPMELKTIAETCEEKDVFRDKLREMSAIYEAYDVMINERYMDTEDDLTRLASKLEHSDQFTQAEIWLDEFTGFTPQEYKVIEKLLMKVSRVNVSLCTDCLSDENPYDISDVFSPVKNSIAKLMKIAQEANILIEPPVVLNEEPFYRFRECCEIAHLERQFYSYPYKPFKDKPEALSIFQAANVYSEVEEAARDILRLCREKGLRYREIAVVTGNLPAYERLISMIFAEHGIPCFIDEKREITYHPLIILLLSLLEIFTRGWSYEAVFRYLKTGLTHISRDEVDMLENYVLACGIRGGRWTQEESWNFRFAAGFEGAAPNEYEQKVLETVNEIRLRLIAPLLAFRSKTRGRKRAREICSALFEFLLETGVPERIETLAEALRLQGELNTANEFHQVWNIVMDILDQIVEAMGEENMGLERFGQVLGIGCNESKMGVIPPALDQVLVGSIDRSRNHEIKALFILGVNDGVFPAVAGEEGILSDQDRGILKSKGIEIAMDTRTRAFEEQYLVYTALTTPSRYLRLSFPIADHEGRTLRPSMIISRLRKLFPGIHQKSNLLSQNTEEEALDSISAPVPAFNTMISCLRQQVDGTEVNLLWWDVYRWFIQREPWSKRCETAFEGIFHTNLAKPVNTEKARQLYGSPMQTSISRLERYANCPFSFFLQYGLKASERKVYKLSAPDVGSFMHSVIDRFSKRVEAADKTWRTLEREWCMTEVSFIVDEWLREMTGSVLNSSKRYGHLAERLKRVLTRAVWLIAEHIRKSGFDPVGYEVAFGENENLPPITVELPSGEKMYLTGRIDRIDSMKTEEGTYLRIIDYKSGSKSFKLSDVYYGLQIQLLTYMDAIWEKGGQGLEPPILPGGILYFRMEDPYIRGGANIQEEEIEKAIMRQLKMKGLLLADVKLIRAMDREMEGDSMIIPARINKGEVLGRSSAATGEQFMQLRKFIRQLLGKIGQEIMNGEVSIQPYKKNKVTSCMYCGYAAVCQFDPTLQDNRYRVLKDVKDEEVWEMIQLTVDS